VVDTHDAGTGVPARGDAGPASYRRLIEEAHADAAIWDYVRYDDEGQLWINGLKVADAIAAYGSPLEIVDTTLVERRCADWITLTREVAERVGYVGRLDYLYAAKANMASEVAHAAYRSGWGAETSSRQDLDHLQWLADNDLLPDGLRVVCNGFKLPPSFLGRPQPDAVSSESAVTLPPDTLSRTVRDASYAESIVRMARDGWAICPILDQDELATFLEPGTPTMDVGLRMKHGRVSNAAELTRLVSRFGLDQATLRQDAARIAASGHLRFTTLHAMVGAATTIPVDEFADALLFAGGVWASLRRDHETLSELNIGGGIPPLSEPYHHAGLVERLLTGLKSIAAEHGVPPPDVTFELGSLVAAECGFHVFRVVQTKLNHVRDDRDPAPWAIIDGGLMAAIPDMLILGKSFRILAAGGADRRARRARLGDPTCDSDGRYPPSSFGPDAAILLPDAGDALHVVILGVGAYQEILAGVRGAHHCGLLEAIELILEPGPDGSVHGRIMPRQTSAEASALLGYSDEAVPALAGALTASQERGG
jgi:arginine decarboxylase